MHLNVLILDNLKKRYQKFLIESYFYNVHAENHLFDASNIGDASHWDSGLVPQITKIYKDKDISQSGLMPSWTHFDAERWNVIWPWHDNELQDIYSRCRISSYKLLININYISFRSVGLQKQNWPIKVRLSNFTVYIIVSGQDIMKC